MKSNTKNTVRKIAWGLFLVAAAVLIIVNGFYDLGFGFGQLIWLIILTPIAIESLIHFSFFGVFIPVAIFGIIFAEPFGIEAITPLPLIAAAILLSIGFEIIFGKHNKWLHFGRVDLKDLEDFVHVEDSETSCVVKFGESTKYITTENLKKAYLKCEFGALIAYFDGATLNPNGATLYIEVNFGGMELFIPKHWNVQNNTNVFLGGVDESSKNTPNPDSPTLTITGKVSFAGVDIRYI